MNPITIQISGGYCSGKSFIKHQIANFLSNELGLNVQADENELNAEAIADRIDNPDKFIEALNEKQTKIVILEVQLNRSAVV